MTDISLKRTAEQCLSETPDMTVLRDVFGYTRGPPETLSVKRQLELVRGQTLGINPILVAPGDFSDGDREDIEYAIQFMRDIYAKVDVGIRKLNWKYIPEDHPDFNGSHEVIDSGDEAQSLTDDWRVDDDFIDMFVVRAANGGAGWSAVDGACDKKAKNSLTGCVVSLNGGQDYIGNTFAHEVAHYLGLEHVSNSSNFIGNNGASNANTGITSSQGATLKGKDCFVKDVC